MKNKNIPVVGKELNIFSNKSDNYLKVGAIKLSEKDLKSEVSFTKALHEVIVNMDNGTYTLHYNNGLFAKFNVKNKKIELHKRSENTGILMPCWNYFEE